MKRMIKFLILTVVFVMLVSCGSQRTIKIGFMGTVTGSSNDLSLTGLHGASLAVQEINEAGGINGRLLELVVKDTLNDKTIAKRVVDEFIREGIEVVIGEFTSSLMQTALEHDRNEKILFLSPTASSGIFTGIDDNMIRFIGETEKQGILLAGQAEKNNDMNFIIIKDSVNRTFVDTTSDAFKDSFEFVGGTVLFETVADYASILRSKDFIKNIMITYPQADGVLFLLDAVNTTLFLQTLDELNWNPGIYTSFWVNSGDFFKLGYQYIEGIHTIGFEEIGDFANELNKFEDSYYQHFGAEPSFSSYFAYDAVIALKNALEESGSLRKKSIKEAIIERGDYSGMAGQFRIDEFGDCSRDYKSLVIRNGHTVLFNIH